MHPVTLSSDGAEPGKYVLGLKHEHTLRAPTVRLCPSPCNQPLVTRTPYEGQLHYVSTHSSAAGRTHVERSGGREDGTTFEANLKTTFAANLKSQFGPLKDGQGRR